MKFSRLLKAVAYEKLEDTKELPDSEAAGVCCDSRKARPGSLFVCIRGSVCDGVAFVPEAAKKGAAVIAAARVQKKELLKALEKYPACTGILVEDEREALALLAAEYEGNPAGRLALVGITGTKGKTTTACMIRKILEEAGIKTGLLGTIEMYDGKESVPSEHTTPDAVCLHRAFARMAKNGCRVCVMEVSSQALKLKRTFGIRFDIGVFLNLGEDHISRFEHADKTEYLACKRKLFFQSRTGIGNADDISWEAVFRETPCEKLTYGVETGEIRAGKVRKAVWQNGRPGVSFSIGEADFYVPVPGYFTVYNALAAAAACKRLGVSYHTAAKALSGFQAKGRAEFVSLPQGAAAVIDYAHNAMSLKGMLEALREYTSGRLIVVFGCGGNRAKARRYEMGKAAGKAADLTVITSDNPRWEEPEQIMDDIEKGLRETGGPYVRITDRREAVFFAVRKAKPGDVVLVAGKGHEDYQEIKGVKYKMDERGIVEEACMQKLS